ncbi:MAG: flagellar assembly protein T N-terminal domain-containing protein [Deltaproteobacteria bacterium]|nr:flagellar assembly protein T N-terminal domain-containing protein [Deltaproteobacteria bacterium]
MGFIKVYFILFSLFILPGVVSGQDAIIVKADGVGDISDGGKGWARDTAIEDALRKAVEQAVGTFIQSETVVKNAILINDEIIARSKGYVQKYDLIWESNDGSLFKVTVEARIASGKLQDDLAGIGLLMVRKHKPRVMVIIPEQHLMKRIPDPAGETEIIKRLLEKGFKVVDQSQVAKIRYNDQVSAAIKGDTSLAIKIGLQYGAEVVIIGEAFSESAGGGLGGMMSCRARVEARAVKTDTGEILVADGKHASGLDITEAIAGKKALQKAGGELADYMTEQILAKWSSDVTNTNSIELVINGISYSQFSQFKSALTSSFRGVKGIHQRSYTGNRGVIEIDLKGDAQTFADELAQKDFKGFNIEVTDFSAGRLELEVVKKNKK